MAEQVKENYLIREIVPDSETIDIQKIPHITQWSNGSTPKPAFQCVILPSPNGNKPAQDEMNQWTIFHLKNNNAYCQKPYMR